MNAASLQSPTVQAHAERRLAFTIGDERHEVRCRATVEPLADDDSPALPVGLLGAMHTGEPLTLHGAVSPQLLGAAPAVQALLRTWLPDLRPVVVHAPTPTPNRIETGREVACFFSGGVDSFYTLLKHQDEITTLILVHGFDMRLEDVALRRLVSARMRNVAQAMGKRLVEVETDLRRFSDPRLHWEYFHGAGLASIGLLLAPLVRKVYIPSTNALADLVPLGTHPQLDPLWSTEGVEFIHDGCEATRVEKTAHLVNSPLAMSHLRVCYENRRGAYNCGRCGKCLRQMATLRALGALERCATFDRPLSLVMLAWSEVHGSTERNRVMENIRAAEAAGDRPLVRALRDTYEGRYMRQPWETVRRLWRWARRWRYQVRDRLRALVGQQPSVDVWPDA